MPLLARYLPRPGRTVLTANGRSYPVTGATVDVPAAEPIAGDQAAFLVYVCTTSARPSNVPGDVAYMPPLTIPQRLYDSDLGAMIFAVPDTFPLRWVTIDGSAA